MKLRALPLAVVAAAAVPSTALACPYCAGRADGGIAQALALALFVMLPFAVALVVAKVVRSGDRMDRDPAGPVDAGAHQLPGREAE